MLLGPGPASCPEAWSSTWSEPMGKGWQVILKQSELETMVTDGRHRGSGSEKHSVANEDRITSLRLPSGLWAGPLSGPQLWSQVQNAADTCGLGESKHGSGIGGLFPICQEPPLFCTTCGALGPKAPKRLRGLEVGERWAKELECPV